MANWCHNDVTSHCDDTTGCGDAVVMLWWCHTNVVMSRWCNRAYLLPSMLRVPILVYSLDVLDRVVLSRCGQSPLESGPPRTVHGRIIIPLDQILQLYLVPPCCRRSPCCWLQPFRNYLCHSACIRRTAWTLPARSKQGNNCWSLCRRGRWHLSHWRRIGVMDAEW